jgi:predicted aminopeptidase
MRISERRASVDGDVAPRRRMRRGRAVVAMIAVAAAASLLSPTVQYLVRGAWAEGAILARRRQITDVIADPRTSSDVRTQLALVLAARQFASDSLGLRVKRSFTMYSKVDHDTLVLVLSGAYRDRLWPITWWFPIVGRVPYKGYFDFKAGIRAVEDLRGQGFDALVRPSPAFSTLGWFNDPVVSTSMSRDSADLANTVVHELTHNTFYASGQAAFNESFASFAGARGAEAFFRSRDDTVTANAVAARWADEKTLGAFWTWVYVRLDSAYRTHPGEDSAARSARLTARDSVFRFARDSLATSVPSRVHTIPASALARARLDNAALLARRVYLTDLEQFDVVYEYYGGDLRRAIRQIIALAKSRREDPFGALEAWVRVVRAGGVGAGGGAGGRAGIGAGE